jgi:hypothetical protein
MGNINKYQKEKLVFAILISDFSLKAKLVALLVKKFGSLDFESEILDFTFSNYYDREMGTPIKRFFISFSKLIEPDSLAAIKITANYIERQFLSKAMRRVNLDPGLLALSRFVLASTKESSHRMAIGRGIYGEITLMYKHGTFRAVEWTYPDYKSSAYINILNAIRSIYAGQLKSKRPS